MFFKFLLDHFGHLDVVLARDQLRDRLLLPVFGRVVSEYRVEAACCWYDPVFAGVYLVDCRLYYRSFVSAFSSAQSRLD